MSLFGYFKVRQYAAVLLRRKIVKQRQWSALPEEIRRDQIWVSSKLHSLICTATDVYIHESSTLSYQCC